jgi:hypothetical protein
MIGDGTGVEACNGSDERKRRMQRIFFMELTGSELAFVWAEFFGAAGVFFDD